MGTSSTIAIERADGTVAQISCHWDGFYSHNGRILLESYTTAEQVESLIALGNLSSLGPELGEAHEFDWHCQNPAEYEKLGHIWCTAYGRDRGETDTQAEIFASFPEFLEQAYFLEFNYIFRNGVWYTQNKFGRWDQLDTHVQRALAEGD